MTEFMWGLVVKIRTKIWIAGAPEKKGPASGIAGNHLPIETNLPHATSGTVINLGRTLESRGNQVAYLI